MVLLPKHSQGRRYDSGDTWKCVTVLYVNVLFEGAKRKKDDKKILKLQNFAAYIFLFIKKEVKSFQVHCVYWRHRHDIGTLTHKPNPSLSNRYLTLFGTVPHNIASMCFLCFYIFYIYSTNITFIDFKNILILNKSLVSVALLFYFQLSICIDTFPL